MHKLIGISATALMVACLATTPASAQLGGLLGINTDNGLELNVLNDTAKVRLGGSGRNIVDADVGNGVVRADVNANDGLNANAGVLRDTVDANVSVGGSRGLVDADVNVGGRRGGGDNGGGGNNGGGNNGGGNNGGGNNGGGNNGGGVIGGGGGGGGTQTAGLGGGFTCMGEGSPIFNQLSSINYSANTVSRWANASNVQFIPISVCPGLDGQLGSGLLAYVAPSVPALQMALAGSRYSASNIVGIIHSGSTLHVYVN